MSPVAKRSSTLLGVLLAALAPGGCGDEPVPAPRDTIEADTGSEVDSTDAVQGETEIDAVDASPDGDTSPLPDADADEIGHDIEGDIEVDSGGRACMDFEACDELPNEDGMCPGRCRSTDDTLRCAGTVKHAVCHMSPPTEAVTEAVDFGDFTVTPVIWPTDAVLGASYDFEVRIHNDTAGALTVPFGWKNPQTFTFEGASWAQTDGFQLGVGATARLTARITALHPTTLSAGADLIATFIFGDGAAFEPRATVHFPDTEEIACGGEHFPASWCPGDGCYEARAFYVSARCCDDVFFPGATCCDDTECFGGACVDGKCVYDAPYLGSANNAALGNQRIRLVLVDSHPQFEDPCADHYEEARGEIDFATIEAWYDALAQRRVGRNTVDFKWIVTGGVATSDFLTGPNYWDEYTGELNAYLAARGCPIFSEALGEGYDKVIVSGSSIDLMGFGGFYTHSGNMAVFSPYNAYLLAHELAHSFGATDLYLDLGGVFLYPRELMGNNLSGPPLPGDRVAWAEMGFGDVDRNGVIDVVELAAFPEALSVGNATATLTAKQAIEIRWEFVASEAGIARRVVVPKYFIRVPAAGAAFEQTYAGRWKIVTFDGTQVDLAAIEEAGQIEVALEAVYRFTDRDWVPRALSFAETLAIPVTRAP